MMKKVLSSAALAALIATASNAADFSFTGTFAADNDVQLFSFSVSTASTVTLQALSYGGGTQADGNVVSAGGFDNILTLFDGLGNLIDSNDDFGGAIDPVTGSDFDAGFSAVLGARTYTVAVTQYDNFANGSLLSDGFFYDGAGNEFFTSTIASCSNGQFCDVNDDNRTNEWAFDILNVDVASAPVVPLPAGLPLMLAGLGAFAMVRRRG